MRGQAAMEYLVTYGWAIAAVLVVIGAFSYFGLTQTDRYIPSSCTIGDGFVCEDFEIGNNGVAFLLSNTGRNDVFLNRVELRIDNAPFGDCSFTDDDDDGLIVLSPGDRREVRCIGDVDRNRVRAEVDLFYRVSNEDDAFVRRASGTVIGETQQRALSEPIAVDGVCDTNRATTFPHSVNNWPGGSNWCSQGTAVLSQGDSFPEQGGSLEWTCQGINGGDSPTCTATRDTAPPPQVPGLCGDVDETVFEADQDRWSPQGSLNYFCSLGTPDQDPVPFPEQGETSEWHCVNDGVSSHTCSVSRKAADSCSDEDVAEACEKLNAACGEIKHDTCGQIDCPNTCKDGVVCEENQCVEQCTPECPNPEEVTCGEKIEDPECEGDCGVGTMCLQQGEVCINDECQNLDAPSCPEPSCNPDKFEPYCSDRGNLAITCKKSEESRDCFVETQTDCGFNACSNGVCSGSSDW